MDAFHDVFETQITFSFVDILEALENLNTDFQIAKAKNQDINSLLQVARSEILLFSLLGLIAPLISFFIAYWVFRNRYKKKIEEFEKKQEEQIFVEDSHIFALAQATDKDTKTRYADSYIGHYWKLKTLISTIANREIAIFTNTEIVSELKKLKPNLDEVLLLNLLSQGEEMMTVDEEISYGVLFDYAKQVDEAISFLNR
jgi:hypothetical protein